MKYRIRIENQTFEVEVKDIQARPVIAIVDGVSFEVWPEKGLVDTPRMPSEQPEVVLSSPKPVEKAEIKPAASSPQETAPTSKSNVVTAPIPGVIIEIMVKPGDVVKYGQELCILEAMKMKNSIRSTRDGKISAVNISTGDQVQHSQVLFEFEE